MPPVPPRTANNRPPTPPAQTHYDPRRNEETYAGPPSEWGSWKNTAPDQRGADLNPDFTYVLQVVQCNHRKSKKPATEGADVFVIDLEVVETTDPNLEVGAPVSGGAWVLHGNMATPNRRKLAAFVSAVLGSDGRNRPGEVTANDIDMLFGFPKDESGRPTGGNKGTALAGVKVKVVTRSAARSDPKTGKPYVDAMWVNLPADWELEGLLPSAQRTAAPVVAPAAPPALPPTVANSYPAQTTRAPAGPPVRPAHAPKPPPAPTEMYMHRDGVWVDPKDGGWWQDAVTQEWYPLNKDTWSDFPGHIPA